MRNKWSSFYVALLVCLAIAGSACAQTANVDTFRKAGAAYFHAGNFIQAAKAYQDVIRLSPDDADAYSHLGEAYSKLNMNKEASAAFAKSAELNEKEADRLLSGRPAPITQPAAAPVRTMTPPAQNAPTQIQPRPAVTGKLPQLTYKVGQRVDYVYDGSWYQAVITDIHDDSTSFLDGKMYAPYRVHRIGQNTNDDAWVCCAIDSDHRTQLRPAGSGPTEPIPGGAAGEANDPTMRALRGVGAVPPPGANSLPLGQYVCDTLQNGIQAHVGGFTLLPGGAYTDESNGHGTFTYDSTRGQLSFKGAGMSGQIGKYDSVSHQFTLQSGNNWVDCERGN
jgi:hypothetical protein